MEQVREGDSAPVNGFVMPAEFPAVATPQPILVLTGLGRSGLREWIFVPKGWDVQALQRRFRFSGTARSRVRTCLATPVSVAELAGMYGEASLTPKASPARLATLLSRTVIAVELTVLKDASAIAEAIAEARAN